MRHMREGQCDIMSLQEISLFPVASLLETGMSNLSQERVGLVWDKITSHLTMVRLTHRVCLLYPLTPPLRCVTIATAL